MISVNTCTPTVFGGGFRGWEAEVDTLSLRDYFMTSIFGKQP